MKKHLLITLKYAAFWGIAEATLGYILHFIQFTTGLRDISGFVMFPIGLFFMLLAYRETGDEASIFYTGLFAGGIKLIDLFIPGLPKGATINPAMAIIIESGIVFAGMRYLKPSRIVYYLPLLSPIWRTVFVLALSISPVSKGILNKGHVAVLYFILIEGIVSGLLCIPVYKWIDTLRKPRIKLHPTLTLPLILLALIVEFITNIL